MLVVERLVADAGADEGVDCDESVGPEDVAIAAGEVVIVDVVSCVVEMMAEVDVAVSVAELVEPPVEEDDNVNERVLLEGEAEPELRLIDGCDVALDEINVLVEADDVVVVNTRVLGEDKERVELPLGERLGTIDDVAADVALEDDKSVDTAVDMAKVDDEDNAC